MAKGRTFCKEKNQITDSIPFSRHSLPTQELKTALSWDSKVKQICIFLSWTLFSKMTHKVARDYPWGGKKIFIILITNLIGIQFFLLCPLFFLSETTDSFHFQILQPLLPFSKSCSPPSVLKILQPPFRSQNPATLFPFSKSYNLPSFLKILRPSFPPQNPASSPFPRVLLLQFLQDVPFFPFPFYLLFLHCQLGASSLGRP